MILVCVVIAASITHVDQLWCIRLRDLIYATLVFEIAVCMHQFSDLVLVVISALITQFD